MPSDSRSFFQEVLGAAAGREVRVSSAFAACFGRSAAFKRSVLGVICRACGFECVAPEFWRYRTEVHTTVGRWDIELIPPENVSLPHLILETKVGARLTKSQLLKYRSTRTKVVALTRRYPEVGPAWLHEHRFVSVRWQAIHRALGSERHVSGADRFLCGEFRSFLEELNMAYRDTPSAAEIAKVIRLFAAIEGDRNSGIDAQTSFEVAGNILRVLDDVLRDVLDRHPTLERWARRGPSYYKWHGPDGVVEHVFGLRLLKQGDWKREWLGADVVFLKGQGQARFVVQGMVGRPRREFRQRYALGRIITGGHMDPAKMVERFSTGLVKSGLLPSRSRK